MQPEKFVEKITTWVGSTASLITHTVVFVAFFILSFWHFLSWSQMLLVLTTLVSLEAIYLAIFIQMTVNRHSEELEEVSEDVEGIQEDIEDISEDVEGIQEDIEEITDEDLESMQTPVTLDALAADIRRVLEDLEELKRKG